MKRIAAFGLTRLGDARTMACIDDRLEHLKAANHSRHVACEIDIAAKRDGTLLGLRAHIYGDMGAYIRTHGGLVPASTAYLLTGPYRGRVSVYLGIATMGQGHETSMAQICADSLGVPFENISVYHGNTDFIPYGTTGLDGSDCD